MKSKRGTLHSLTLLASQGGQTPLFAASEYGHLPVVKFLVEQGAKVDVADKVALH